MKIRLKNSEDGKNKILDVLEDQFTVSELKQTIANFFGSSEFLVFHKFPLEQLDLSRNEQTIKEIGVVSAETLTIQRPRSFNSPTLTKAKPPPPPKPFVVLREIADDNSCLFNSIKYVFKETGPVVHLRDIVAEYILARPREYTTAVLGQSPTEYARWIRLKDTWGGAIELSIFSMIYGVEIASFDVKTERMDLFGEGKNYTSRIYLQYTGIHYEVYALKTSDNPSDDITLFSVDDSTILHQVKELVHCSQVAHRFTDLSGFTIRCSDCRVGLRGESEAQAHAKTFGHYSFTEYSNK